MPTRPIVSFATGDPEIASDRLQTLYGASAKAEREARRPGFLLDMQAAKVGRLTLSAVTLDNIAFQRDTGDTAWMVLPQRGDMRMCVGGREEAHAPGMSFAVGAPFERCRIVIERGAGVGLTSPLAALAAQVETLTQRPCTGAMQDRISQRVDATSPVARALARCAKTALAEIGALAELGLGALAMTSYEELLLGLMAAALFPEVAQTPAPDCGSATVRRARDYIRENAGDRIEIATLAGELGVGMRALQQNFRRAYGVSPRDYLMEVRLELAREALLGGDREATVAAIAFSSGFSDLSRFSGKYRERYGELPSQTLRVAQA